MASVVVTDSNYEFVPPHTNKLWPRFLSWFVPGILRRNYGVTELEYRGTDKLKVLTDAGHGVLLAPNHSRMCDAFVLDGLSKSIRRPSYVMASSHLFRQSRFQSFLLRRLGAFSIYREGVDRKAVQQGIDILREGDRPLVLFPEGTVSQANERLKALMDGVSFIARSAARKVEKENPSQKVYVVPVAIRYLFQGDIQETAGKILTDIELRLSWKSQDHLSLVERIYKVGLALLSLKEMEYLGAAQEGTHEVRLENLINHLMHPLEREWLGEERHDSVVAHVKELRKAILPDMVANNLEQAELDRRFKQLKDIEMAQQLCLYPPNYVNENPTADRILETVERFWEHLSGDESPHPPLKAVIEVCEPIEVQGKRDKSLAEDPVMKELAESLTEKIAELSLESQTYRTPAKRVTTTTQMAVVEHVG
ncbi:MAG: lysophospholipid acyltransferase family protein [Planctomycetaceae bacterium]|nr:lysophospholipid acyltransferase family protein [Planctomycetaceae bacterium]